MTAVGTPNPQAVQQFLIAVLDYVIARDAAKERAKSCAVETDSRPPAVVTTPLDISSLEKGRSLSLAQNKQAGPN